METVRVRTVIMIVLCTITFMIFLPINRPWVKERRWPPSGNALITENYMTEESNKDISQARKYTGPEQAPPETQEYTGPKQAPPETHKKQIDPNMGRAGLGTIANERAYKTGVELGVQRGIYSHEMLSRWPSCTKYVVVDLWAQQPNYSVPSNIRTDLQLRLYHETLRRLKTFGSKVEDCRNYTSVCVQRFEDAAFDLIYVDAQHDYHGVLEDLTDWSPKLKENGIIAGHDYLYTNHLVGTAVEKRYINNGQMRDVSRRGVLGAVNDFFGILNGYTLEVMDDATVWKTWVVDTAKWVDHSGHVPPVFHFLWVSNDFSSNKPIGVAELKNINTWQHLLPLRFVVLWTDEMVKKHFNSLLPQLLSKTSTDSMKQLLKYAVLSKYGGVYLDNNIAGVKQIDFTSKTRGFTVCAVEISPFSFIHEDGQCGSVLDGIIGLSRNHPAAKEMVSKLSNGTGEVTTTSKSLWQEVGKRFDVDILSAVTFHAYIFENL